MQNSPRNGTILIIIDPQNDFMDTKHAALPVAGAKADMRRLSKWMRINLHMIDHIVVTLDTHRFDHIAHPMRWLTERGEHPAPFTTITVEDVETGKYRASTASDCGWQQSYVRRLRERGGKDLMIWPPHCLMNQRGHDIEPTLNRSLARWMEETGRQVEFIQKGMCRDTEQYGAFAADVEILSVPSTRINIPFLKKLRSYQRHIWAGEALSHCLMASFEQAYDDDFISTPAERIILTDATSPVAGFEKSAEEWLTRKRSNGVVLEQTESLMLTYC